MQRKITGCWTLTRSYQATKIQSPDMQTPNLLSETGEQQTKQTEQTGRAKTSTTTPIGPWINQAGPIRTEPTRVEAELSRVQLGRADPRSRANLSRVMPSQPKTEPRQAELTQSQSHLGWSLPSGAQLRAKWVLVSFSVVFPEWYRSII